MSHVVVAIITKNDNPKKYLLVNSKKDFGEFTGFYYPPGGHIKEGEDEITALKREIFEELHINITKATKITDTDADIKDQKTSWYFCDVDSYNFLVDKKKFIEKNDVKKFGFFSENEMKNIRIWPATKSIFEKYVFGK